MMTNFSKYKKHSDNNDGQSFESPTLEEVVCACYIIAGKEVQMHKINNYNKHQWHMA